MIDAVRFASSYNAFWHAYTPMCEHFVRRLNLAGLKRFALPLSASDTKRRALIAEYAFSYFVQRMNNKLQGVARSEGDVEELAWHEAERRLRPFANQGLELRREFDSEERNEVTRIAESLIRFFDDRGQQLVLRPTFSGCGFVDSSEGDVIIGQTLFEVKTVDRRFRGNDIRQTITYAALNFASREFVLNNVGLFNPRIGQYCELDLDSVCSEISGRPAQELLALVIQAISSGEISR